MRYLLGVILVVVMVTTTVIPAEREVKGQYLKNYDPDRYFGEIAFKDGIKIDYAWLSNRRPASKIIYPSFDDNRDIIASSASIETSYPERRIKFSAISRIDFSDLTEEESKKVKEFGEYIRSPILKGKITFRGSAVWDSMFFYPENGWEYKSELAEGLLTAEVKSITINLKDAKECPNCHRQYIEPEWKFCPYDGTPLQ